MIKIFFLLLSILSLSSCKEFYDEEFEDFEESRGRTSGSGGRSENITYSVELNSTDANLPDLSGTARIEVRNDEVTVDLDVDGIPANIIQVHYGYIAAGCNQLSLSIPNNNTTTRSYTVSERASVDALADDLRSSGATTTDRDIFLAGKSFVVKAFSNFSGLPNPTGTNQITILCGVITEEDNEGSTVNDDIFNPPTTDGTPTGGTPLPSPFPSPFPESFPQNTPNSPF